MKEAVDKENYERASQLRDDIRKIEDSIRAAEPGQQDQPKDS
jgi:protein-arginine kinase activator protein McsA